ncbi:MAG: hypothetical protein KY454_07725 [Actinobacteria bacterium]|nr:hypothetical protein [Actinomycetota bacterium]
MDGQPAPEATAVATARAFVAAVAWGEHHKVWEMLSSGGRSVVLRVASKRGMDEAMVARLRDGTAASSEREQFLTDLVNGLRADLEGNNLEGLDFEPDPAPEPGRSRVILVAPMPAGLSAGLPVGSVELTDEGHGWRVERLLPRPGQA